MKKGYKYFWVLEYFPQKHHIIRAGPQKAEKSGGNQEMGGNSGNAGKYHTLLL